MLYPPEPMMSTLSRALATLPAAVLFCAPAVAAQTRDTLRVAGLREPVEIVRDRWGINHLYAKSEHDLFFAQGYAAAHDRLFQLELWRRQATGTVAELLGPRELRRDIGTRLFKFRGSLDRELAHYHPRGRAIVQAYVDGVNAFVAQAERDSTLVPLELRMLGARPGRWTRPRCGRSSGSTRTTRSWSWTAPSTDRSSRPTSWGCTTRSAARCASSP